MTVEIRECSCLTRSGGWCERCLHFDGRVLGLYGPYPAGFRWIVELHDPSPGWLLVYRYTDYDAALAAFREAAERLVQGD